LHTDQHANVRRAVAQALGKRATASALEALTVLQKDIDPWVRAAAEVAMHTIENG